MSTIKKDLLFDLINSLTKSEKRNFRIYAKKIQQSGNVLFLQLFDYLEKQEQFDVNTLLNELNTIRAGQIPNLKRNLYQHILASLRLIYSEQEASLKIRKFLDYAEILYGKGLYLQALKILARAKKIAKKNHEDALHLEVIEFEKVIESRHITRSSTARMSDLIKEADFRMHVNVNRSDLSNLKLYLQRFFINHGHLRESKDILTIQAYFQKEIGTWVDDDKTFFEKIHYYQAYYWFYYLDQNFEACYDYSKKWMDLYVHFPTMKIENVDMYLIGLHHLLNTAFFTRHVAQLQESLNDYEEFLLKHKDGFNLNTFLLANLFYYQAYFDHCFLTGTYQKGLAIIPEVEQFLATYAHQLDSYKTMILYYKIACIQFGSGNLDQSIDTLNIIINNQSNSLRHDIVIFARILLILGHFDLENETILPYLITSTQRLINKFNGESQLSLCCIKYLKKVSTAELLERKNILIDFQEEVKALKQLKSERRSFIFLDMPLWLESKLDKKTIIEVALNQKTSKLDAN